MVDVRFELTTNDPWSVDDAICEGISPLGYCKRLTNRLPKLSLTTLSPPSEQRDTWSSYGAPDPGRVIDLSDS